MTNHFAKLLDLTISGRISELLENPYAGSKIPSHKLGRYPYNLSKDLAKHQPFAKYLSNCCGTALYVLSVPPSKRSSNTRPSMVEPYRMYNILSKKFNRAHTNEAGQLICIFDDYEESILHCAVSLDTKNRIFHQPDTGLPFEKSTIDDYIRNHLREESTDTRTLRYNVRSDR